MAYGYEDGLLSNSMLQAAITCPVKYQKLYVERSVDPEARAHWFDATTVGIVVHECIEIHDNDIDGLRKAAWDHLERIWSPASMALAKQNMEVHQIAVKDTQAQGARYGRVYKAPEMTGHWKKNYAFLEERWDQFDSLTLASLRSRFGKDPIFSIPPSAMVRQVMTALDNWLELRITDSFAEEQVVKQELYYPLIEAGKKVRVGTIDRLEERPGGIAICDYKTGRWPYNEEKVANSDQFGLYDQMLTEQGHTVVEWVLYDLVANQCVRVTPNDKLRAAFRLRDAQNVAYHEAMKNAPVGVPAGMSYKIGCPCILAETGDCPYYVKLD